MSEVIRQRRMQANYLDCGGTNKSPNFSLLGVGAKTLDENPAAQTKSRKYVCDKSATKSISGYDWTTAFEIDQIREQDAINYIINIGEKQLVGADAETDYVIVDLDQSARKIRVAVEVASFTNDDGEMGCSGNFLAKGDPVEGTFDTATKTFTATTEA